VQGGLDLVLEPRALRLRPTLDVSAALYSCRVCASTGIGTLRPCLLEAYPCQLSMEGAWKEAGSEGREWWC
jgi:hypothetical protein